MLDFIQFENSIRKLVPAEDLVIGKDVGSYYCKVKKKGINASYYPAVGYVNLNTSNGEVKKCSILELFDYLAWQTAKDATSELIDKYFEAGGSKKEMMTEREITWFFFGMLQRDGVKSVRNFLNEWKYRPRQKANWKGYASYN